MSEQKFQVGDEVFSIQGGDGVVETVRDGLSSIYPVVAVFGENTLSYTCDGKLRLSDVHPSLYYRGAKIVDGPAHLRKNPKPTLEPFQKVLVRNNKEHIWRADIFSHYMETYTATHVCITNDWIFCIPYDGNEHLLGTTEARE
jgi:hypothetical protein